MQYDTASFKTASDEVAGKASNTHPTSGFLQKKGKEIQIVSLKLQSAVRFKMASKPYGGKW